MGGRGSRGSRSRLHLHGSAAPTLTIRMIPIDLSGVSVTINLWICRGDRAMGQLFEQAISLFSTRMRRGSVLFSAVFVVLIHARLQYILLKYPEYHQELDIRQASHCRERYIFLLTGCLS